MGIGSYLARSGASRISIHDTTGVGHSAVTWNTHHHRKHPQVLRDERCRHSRSRFQNDRASAALGLVLVLVVERRGLASLVEELYSAGVPFFLEEYSSLELGVQENFRHG